MELDRSFERPPAGRTKRRESDSLRRSISATRDETANHEPESWYAIQEEILALAAQAQ